MFTLNMTENAVYVLLSNIREHRHIYIWKWHIHGTINLIFFFQVKMQVMTNQSKIILPF